MYCCGKGEARSKRLPSRRRGPHSCPEGLMEMIREKREIPPSVLLTAEVWMTWPVMRSYSTSRRN